MDPDYVISKNAGKQHRFLYPQKLCQSMGFGGKCILQTLAIYSIHIKNVPNIKPYLSAWELAFGHMPPLFASVARKCYTYMYTNCSYTRKQRRTC